MKQLFFLAFAICLISPISSMANQYNNGDVYFQGSYHQAINKAQLQGKLMVLEFSADWCIPCQWMKKTTFKDPVLVDYLTKNTVTLDVNIDDFDGFELKQQYEVQFLPTIIILNTEGDILVKIEQSLSAEKLRKIIEGHFTSNNTKKIDVKPINIIAPSTEDVIEDKPLGHKEEMITHDIEKVNGSNDEAFISQTEEEDKSSNAHKPLTTSISSIKYILQIGAFSTLKSAQEVGSSSTSAFNDHPIIIQFENGIYKVISTQFNSRADAEGLKALLSNEYDTKSFIRTE